MMSLTAAPFFANRHRRPAVQRGMLTVPPAAAVISNTAKPII